jgi:uncharacterized iron-regulated protein
MKRKSIVLFALMAIWALAGFSQISQKNYRIYSVKTQKEVTPAEIAADMKTADVLFFGEEHNDSVTHFLEISIFEELYKLYNSQLTLSMEMFERDVQPIMNEYLMGMIRERDFLKDAKVWSNYRDYRPMVEFAKKNKLDVVCANAAGRYSNIAGKKGQKGLALLPVESKSFFAPLPYDTATGKYHEKLMDMMGHNAADTSKTTKAPPMGMMGAFNLVMAQSLWDATMAYSISEYVKKNPTKKIFQVNGRFHSDEGFAVVTQLKKYSTNAKILVISTGSDDSFPNINWAKFIHLGDYIVITDPKVPRTYESK